MQWIHLIATGGNSLGVIFSVCTAQRKPPKITVFRVSFFFLFFFSRRGGRGVWIVGPLSKILRLDT